MRVLLADDHSLLLEGLGNLLQAHGVEVAGVAHDGYEAVALTRETVPDVVVMDIRMPNCDGLVATRLIKAEMPEIPVVILTTSSEDADLFEAIRSGASGYLLKSMDAATLVEALGDAVAGVPPLAPGLAARLLAEFARVGKGDVAPSHAATPDAPHLEADGEDALTPRQLEILHLVAEGLSYNEIGRRVFLSPRTVKYHMAEVMRKVHLHNRAQVLAFAARRNLGDG